MNDRVAQLAFLDPRTADLRFCSGETCIREDREQRIEPCSTCIRATKQETVGASIYRVWKAAA